MVRIAQLLFVPGVFALACGARDDAESQASPIGSDPADAGVHEGGTRDAGPAPALLDRVDAADAEAAPDITDWPPGAPATLPDSWFEPSSAESEGCELVLRTRTSYLEGDDEPIEQQAFEYDGKRRRVIELLGPEPLDVNLYQYDVTADGRRALDSAWFDCEYFSVGEQLYCKLWNWYEYDQAGRLSSFRSESEAGYDLYRYDAEGRLASWEGYDIIEPSSATYHYDGPWLVQSDETYLADSWIVTYTHVHPEAGASSLILREGDRDSDGTVDERAWLDAAGRLIVDEPTPTGGLQMYEAGSPLADVRREPSPTRDRWSLEHTAPLWRRFEYTPEQVSDWDLPEAGLSARFEFDDLGRPVRFAYSSDDGERLIQSFEYEGARVIADSIESEGVDVPNSHSVYEWACSGVEL